jgi:hypothetical protein
MRQYLAALLAAAWRLGDRHHQTLCWSRVESRQVQEGQCDPQVQVFLHATITRTWSSQTERVKKGAYAIHKAVVVVQYWQVQYLCILAPSSTPQPQRRASRCHFCLQHHNSVSSQPHQLTTRLSFCTGTSHQSHVCLLLSNTPSYAYQYVVRRECQLTGRQEGYMDGPQHDNKCVCPSPCLIQQA